MSVSGLIGAAVGVVVVISGAALHADDPIHSRWRTEDLRVDGVMTDWSGLTYVSKEVSVSAANDGQDVYLVVATSDPGVKAQVMRAGLAVYFDPKGKKGKTFGVRIPPVGARLAPGNGTPRPDDPPLLSYFDILGPGDDDIRRVQVEEAPDVAVRIGDHLGTFFLELRVPLAVGDGRPYSPGIDVAKGVAGLGIVTPEPPRTASRGEGRGSSSGGRSGGRGGGRGGATGGGAAGGFGGAQGKAIKIWTTIVLAKRNL